MIDELDYKYFLVYVVDKWEILRVSLVHKKERILREKKKKKEKEKGYYEKGLRIKIMFGMIYKRKERLDYYFIWYEI